MDKPTSDAPTQRIATVVCHGIMPRRRHNPLTADRYAEYFRIAAELGFNAITYDQLDRWWRNGAPLPPRPILINLDHPERSTYDTLFPQMAQHGFVGNLFINTAQIELLHANNRQQAPDRTTMRWDEVGNLVAAGWQIGAHTHTHPNICDLCMADPEGNQIRSELDISDTILRDRLGIESRDFAYVLESWHSLAEIEVRKRYRFARLWVTGTVYWADGMLMKFQDLAGFPGPDAPDGGPPEASRYITHASNPHRLPGMELGELIYTYDAFRAYLEGSLVGTPTRQAMVDASLL